MTFGELSTWYDNFSLDTWLSTLSHNYIINEGDRIPKSGLLCFNKIMVNIIMVQNEVALQTQVSFINHFRKIF